MLEKISYRCKWTRESDTDTHKFTHFFASYKCHSPDASSMCTDRRFQPWAPCRCKPDKTGPVHHALRQPGVQLDELILKLTQNTQNTQIHSEGYDIFETAGILKHAQGWAMETHTSWEGQPCSQPQTTRATVDFHSDSSAAVAAFFKALLWRGILRADTDVQEPSRTHFRIPEFVPLKDCLSYSNNSRRRHCTGVAAIWDIIKTFFASGPAV